VFLGIPARRRTWRRMLCAIAALAALSILSACGDFWEAPSGNSAAGTTTGTYTFTVTGTGSPTVTAVTTTFSLTVD
jgi:ABC-type phosphate transport system substrate-binding protein